jgi:hypothetical protein
MRFDTFHWSLRENRGRLGRSKKCFPRCVAVNPRDARVSLCDLASGAG